MTEKQYKLVEPILDTIENEDLKELCVVILDDFPEYIWEVPGSSSGKYHPAQDLGEGGLMRHQVCVARVCNYILQLDQYRNRIGSRERDCMRIASLCHDGRKSGLENRGNTVHEHPVLMGDEVWKLVTAYPELKDELDIIRNCIYSHSGQWTTSKRSELVLPEPVTEIQELVHLSDYIASRKDIEMQFDGWEKPPLPDINEYALSFGKHKGKTLVEINSFDTGYIDWLKENYGKEPVRSLLKQL